MRKHGFHRRRCVSCNAGRDVLPTNRLDRFTRLAKIGCVEIGVGICLSFQTKQIYTLDLFLGDLGLEPFYALAEVFVTSEAFKSSRSAASSNLPTSWLICPWMATICAFAFDVKALSLV